jgi:hypothetical protein
MSDFLSQPPTLDAYWRAVILFGRNTASYKFALGTALLELAHGRATFVTLNDLAPLYLRKLGEHLKNGARQGNFTSSGFLDAIAGYLDGQATYEQLLEQTVRLGFANVIDAFHVVNQSELPVRFFIDERKARNGITITDELFRLGEGFQFNNLPAELEARWRLVETAWTLRVAPRLLVVHHDEANGELFIPTRAARVSVTSGRDALSGYQKGRCFFCYADISLKSATDLAADVDHFFPHILKHFHPPLRANLDGI